MDVAAETVAPQPGFVPPGAVGRIGPYAGPGVRGIEAAFAQEPAIVAAGVGDLTQRISRYRRSMPVWALQPKIGTGASASPERRASGGLGPVRIVHRVPTSI